MISPSGCWLLVILRVVACVVVVQGGGVSPRSSRMFDTIFRTAVEWTPERSAEAEADRTWPRPGRSEAERPSEAGGRSDRRMLTPVSVRKPVQGGERAASQTAAGREGCSGTAGPGTVGCRRSSAKWKPETSAGTSGRDLPGANAPGNPAASCQANWESHADGVNSRRMTHCADRPSGETVLRARRSRTRGGAVVRGSQTVRRSRSMSAGFDSGYRPPDSRSPVRTIGFRWQCDGGLHRVIPAEPAQDRDTSGDLVPSP